MLNEKICDELVSIRRTDLTNYVGRLSPVKLLELKKALRIALDIEQKFFARNPKILHVVDISENNMVELVRDIRSSVGYGDC